MSLVARVVVSDQRDLGPGRRPDLERGAIRAVCGDKHPREFGSDYRVCWASAWPAIGGAFETARAGETAFLENQPMFLDRNGYLEETWFTFSLSPIRDESGAGRRPFHPVTETTPRMLAERRTRALRDLARAARAARATCAQAIALSLERSRLRARPAVRRCSTSSTRTARRRGSPGTPAWSRRTRCARRRRSASERRGALGRRGARRRAGHVPISSRGSAPSRPARTRSRSSRRFFLPISLPGVERPAGVLVAGREHAAARSTRPTAASSTSSPRASRARWRTRSRTSRSARGPRRWRRSIAPRRRSSATSATSSARR